jgi:hypothetical protein
MRKQEKREAKELRTGLVEEYFIGSDFSPNSIGNSRDQAVISRKRDLKIRPEGAYGTRRSTHTHPPIFVFLIR